jgi:hypothetical protein
MTKHADLIARLEAGEVGPHMDALVRAAIEESFPADALAFKMADGRWKGITTDDDLASSVIRPFLGDHQFWHNHPEKPPKRGRHRVAVMRFEYFMTATGKGSRLVEVASGEAPTEAAAWCAALLKAEGEGMTSLADLTSNPAARLSTPEIRRRVRAMMAGAAEAGFEVGAIRMSPAGEITLVDKSLVPANDRAARCRLSP